MKNYRSGIVRDDYGIERDWVLLYEIFRKKFLTILLKTESISKEDKFIWIWKCKNMAYMKLWTEKE